MAADRGAPRRWSRRVDVTKRFGATVALDGAGIADQRRRDATPWSAATAPASPRWSSILTGLQAPDEGEVALRRRARAAAGRPGRLAAAGGLRLPEVHDHPRRSPWRRTSTSTGSGAAGRSAGRPCAARPGSCWRRRSVDVDVTHAAPATSTSSSGSSWRSPGRCPSAPGSSSSTSPPPSSTPPAIDRLFARIRALQEQGVTFLFISHHLQEIYEICDTRHGLPRRPAHPHHPGRRPAARPSWWRHDRRGRRPGRRIRPGRPRPPAPAWCSRCAASSLGEALRERRLRRSGPARSSAWPGAAAAARSSLAETIVGLRTAGSGTVTVDGSVVPARAACRTRSPRVVGFVPQDRHHQGFVPLLSIAENATMTVARPARRGSARSARPGAATRWHRR